jgi:hypothetical protein
MATDSTDLKDAQMFKLSHLYAGNGGMQSLTGGTTSLASALAAVERAEAALAAARNLAKAVAKREGQSVRGLFENSRFVLRETAERWTDTARREGEKNMAAIFTRDLDTESADENSPFRHLAKRLKKMSSADWADHVARMHAARTNPRNEQARALVEAGEHDAAAVIYAEIFQGTKADRIVRAGARARMSADAEVPEPGGLAKKIIDAGRRRRGEIE